MFFDSRSGLFRVVVVGTCAYVALQYAVAWSSVRSARGTLSFLPTPTPEETGR